MTELLQQAIDEISKLSTEQQDAIASRLLAELQDEQIWQERFDATALSKASNVARSQLSVKSDRDAVNTLLSLSKICSVPS